jgi:hypothetical protein
MKFYLNPDGPANYTGSNIRVIDYDMIKSERLKCLREGFNCTESYQFFIDTGILSVHGGR